MQAFGFSALLTKKGAAELAKKRLKQSSLNPFLAPVLDCL